MSSTRTSSPASGRSEDLAEDGGEEARDMDMDRWDRYVETKGESIELLTNKPEDMKPFYNGKVLDSRMADIRKFIFYIRQNWEKYSEFLEELKTLLKEDGTLNFKTRKRVICLQHWCPRSVNGSLRILLLQKRLTLRPSSCTQHRKATERSIVFVTTFSARRIV